MKLFLHINRDLMIRLSAITTALLAIPHRAMAQAEVPQPITIQPVIGFTSAQEALTTLMSVVGFVGALLCFFYIVWGAYKYLTAGDNAANTAAARQTILNAVIGLVLLGMVVVIFNFVASFIPGLKNAF